MRPCTRCRTANLKVKPIFTKYPCKIGNRVTTPCSAMDEEKHEVMGEMREGQKERIPKKRNPCEGIQVSLRRTFKFLWRNNCQLPFSRAWNKNDNEMSSKYELLPKWVRRRPTVSKSHECPREWDDYERKLCRRICKPPVKPPEEVILEPVDQAVCIFCLGSLYTGGYLHDLHEKIPYVKKQSEENDDDIIRRIGIRTRVTVHKKCYNEYIDRTRAEGEAPAVEEDESDSDVCGEIKKEEEEEEVADLVTVKEKNICLRKPKVPKLPSGECFPDFDQRCGAAMFWLYESPFGS